ncbi:hypothetical protein [Leptospira bandrabouensis]|uniref:hypothetical protein n=2 Tax=Leptospira bandrabouensis TaxID=2484903 RepID=UPI001EEA3F8A|nr:hypothetical protein [Leptospira bandrabouensis]MCG6145564.1 hypothetical protein [Leptospira bandrabouensis]MCG6165434.1 hypothetical protein [Leptospira bandrabouensis]
MMFSWQESGRHSAPMSVIGLEELIQMKPKIVRVQDFEAVQALKRSYYGSYVNLKKYTFD